MEARYIESIYRGIKDRRQSVLRQHSDVEIDVKYRGVAYHISPTTLTLQQPLVLYKYRGVGYTKRYC